MPAKRHDVACSGCGVHVRAYLDDKLVGHAQAAVANMDALVDGEGVVVAIEVDPNSKETPPRWRRVVLRGNVRIEEEAPE